MAEAMINVGGVKGSASITSHAHPRAEALVEIHGKYGTPNVHVALATPPVQLQSVGKVASPIRILSGKLALA